jgi:hypothetical protein
VTHFPQTLVTTNKTTCQTMIGIFWQISHNFYFHNTLNVMVEWLILMLHIWEVPGSKLGPDTDYSEFLWFSSVPPGKCQDSTLKLGHDHFLPILFNSSLTYHPFIQRYIVSVTENTRCSMNYKYKCISVTFPFQKENFMFVIALYFWIREFFQ